MTVKLIIATNANREAAAAVIYPVNAGSPLFQYWDRKGSKHARHFFDSTSLVPDYLHGHLRSYVKRTALSWAVSRLEGNSRVYAMGLAATRALERMMHQSPLQLDGVSKENLLIYPAGKVALPLSLVTDISQVLNMQDWRIVAATALLKLGGVHERAAVSKM